MKLCKELAQVRFPGSSSIGLIPPPVAPPARENPQALHDFPEQPFGTPCHGGRPRAPEAPRMPRIQRSRGSLQVPRSGESGRQKRAACRPVSPEILWKLGTAPVRRKPESRSIRGRRPREDGKQLNNPNPRPESHLRPPLPDPPKSSPYPPNPHLEKNVHSFLGFTSSSQDPRTPLGGTSRHGMAGSLTHAPQFPLSRGGGPHFCGHPAAG